MSDAEKVSGALDVTCKDRMRTALTIAGSDSSGGAGIQADIKTMTVCGVYAMSAITALTAQNTTGVSGVIESPPGFLAKQIDAVFSDIRPDAVKIGMVSSASLARIIAERLTYWKAQNIVVDPVAVATSGSALSSGEAYEAVKTMLFPLAAVITPNIPEAELISGMKITNSAEMKEAAKKITAEFGCPTLCKGGHMVNDASDYLAFPDGRGMWFKGERIDNPNTHGTGCTLSSAIAAGLAKGLPLHMAVGQAKRFISGALSAMLDLGQGSGPLDHGYLIHNS